MMEGELKVKKVKIKILQNPGFEKSLISSVRIKQRPKVKILFYLVFFMVLLVT